MYIYITYINLDSQIIKPYQKLSTHQDAPEKDNSETSCCSSAPYVTSSATSFRGISTGQVVCRALEATFSSHGEWMKIEATDSDSEIWIILDQ
jgi:hypothetical protein